LEIFANARFVVGIDHCRHRRETNQLFLEFRTAGVSFHQTLKKEPWGAMNFIVMDPDRNLILFSGPAD
jgi:hypothetical protein